MASVDSVARILALAADGSSGGGTGGTSNYNDLANKPRINGVELTGNKTLEDLGIESGITETELNAAIATEASTREAQDAALQTAINGKLSASNIHAGENITINTDGSDVTINADLSDVESDLKDYTDTAIGNLDFATEDYVTGQISLLNIQNGTNARDVRQDGATASGGSSAAFNAAVASGSNSFATGLVSTASGVATIAMGTMSVASGEQSVAIGVGAEASGYRSIALGNSIEATGTNETVLGSYNIVSSDSSNVLVVGNGQTEAARSNAFTLGFDGNAWFQGDVRVGGSDYSSGSELITKDAVSLSTSGDIISLIVSGETIGEIPAPSIQFNGAEAFVAKEVKTFYEETSKVPETVNGVAFGSDVSGGNLSYFTEENGPYLVLTNRDILDPSNVLGGNVIILKDIVSSDLPSVELLTIQVDGTTVGTYDGSEATTINIEAATKEYVQELITTINGATFEVVTELPTTDIKTNVIYLVPAQSSGVVGNIYNEYIYIENAWELIGSTSVTVDLENYLAKDNVSSYEPTGDYNPATKKYVDDAIAECKDYVLEAIKQATIDGDWWMQS